MIDFNTDVRYSRIQRLQKASGPHHIITSKKKDINSVMVVMAFIFAGSSLAVTLTQDNVFQKFPPALKLTKTLNCRDCHNREQQMVDYFKKSGNKHPEVMAEAVLAVKPKNQKWSASIATKGEKNTPYTVRRGGYKGRHAGAWQISEKDWGFVPYDAVGQALKAERILEDLTETMPVKKALSLYGGDSTSNYQRRVLSELTQIP